MFCISLFVLFLLAIVFVCSFSIYGFWLPLWYLVAIVLSVLWYMDFDYPFGILWPLYCLSFDIWILITPLVSCGHCIACPLTYGFWWPLWYLQTFLSTVVLTIKTSPSSACIVEHPISAYFYVFVYISNLLGIYSSFFDLKSVYSVNTTFALTVVPVRLRCVISYHLLWCVVKSLFLCVSIFFTCFTPVLDDLFFHRFFHYTIVFQLVLH
jgi:hypothetical protein